MKMPTMSSPAASPELLGALPVDVEEHVAPFAQGCLDGAPRRAIGVAVDRGVLEQFARLDHGAELLVGDEMVVVPIHLRRPPRPRRHRDRHGEFRLLAHHRPRDRGLAGARRRGHDQHQAASAARNQAIKNDHGSVPEVRG
jgi:hypothetical protein